MAEKTIWSAQNRFAFILFNEFVVSPENLLLIKKELHKKFIDKINTFEVVKGKSLMFGLKEIGIFSIKDLNIFVSGPEVVKNGVNCLEKTIDDTWPITWLSNLVKLKIPIFFISEYPPSFENKIIEFLEKKAKGVILSIDYRVIKYCMESTDGGLLNLPEDLFSLYDNHLFKLKQVKVGFFEKRREDIEKAQSEFIKKLNDLELKKIEFE